MAEEETVVQEEVVADLEEQILEEARRKQGIDVSAWHPKTGMGKLAKEGKIDIDYILDNGLKPLESEIIDALVPNVTVDLLFVGQSKGKFGGGQRRVFKQTQKKTQEGNKPKFATIAAIGNKDGYVGIGYGKSKETVPAREKSMRNAKLNLIKIKRGCGSWYCGCKQPHSIPFTVKGKCGSVIVELIPAPKGTGLCVETECKKVLGLAGIKDVWSKTSGQTRSKINLLYACFSALKQLSSMKLPNEMRHLGIVEGKIK